ncbi:aspartate kinase [Xanthobacteraceae bacterium Astr-EGSB]|uniref:aspartate kinase n=1 Tax=Astrobacterium formosum TaxID=3069710 RepID=UPI0027AFA5CC|nr:aspartate kinase [Xanthobacteraceae bacterium Astr-EGSB]
MAILVQKFGGTSVSTPERRQQVIAKISAATKAGYSPVVVVSALGRRGESYATDTLLNLARQECPSIDSRELDMIMACGEIVAGVIVVGALKNAGFDAVFLSGQQAGIITTMKHGDAQIVEIKPVNVLKHVAEGKIVVVAGFQGATESGEITTLGRGGSDTTATAMGAAVAAAAVEIYTDVNGIMTADPRIVPAASTIESCTYEEAHQLALHGAKVIHPRAVEIAWRHNVPLKVKCTFTDEAGTTISSKAEGTIERLRDRAVVGIAHETDYGVLTLKDANSDAFAGAGRLLGKMASVGVDADHIQVSKRDMEVAASAANIETIAALGQEIGMKSAEQVGSRISLVGGSANSVSGLADTFIELLQRERIALLQTSTEPYAISGIVDKKDMTAAIQALHGRLFESQRTADRPDDGHGR